MRSHRRRPVADAPPPRLRRGTRLALVGAAGTLFAVYPFALIALASPLRGPQPRAYEVARLPRTLDPSLRLSTTVSGGSVELKWKDTQPWMTRVFYRIWRSNAPGGGASCTPVVHAPDYCALAMDDLGAAFRTQDHEVSVVAIDFKSGYVAKEFDGARQVVAIEFEKEKAGLAQAITFRRGAVDFLARGILRRRFGFCLVGTDGGGEDYG